MDGNADDPFDSLAQLCILSDSQEDVLRHCPFAGGRKLVDFSGCFDSERFPLEPTGIFMPSQPESLEQRERSTPHETPPEESAPASDRQRSLAVDDPCLKDAVAVPVGAKVAAESGCMGDPRAVDLDLGLHSEVQSTDEIQIIGVRRTGVLGSEARKCRLPSDESCWKGESSSKRLKLTVVDLTESDGETTLEPVSSVDHNNKVTEESVMETNGGAEDSSGVDDGKASNGETHCNKEKFAEKEVREEKVEKSQADEPNKFQETTNRDKSRRVLPSSISGVKVNAEKKWDETEASPSDNSGKAKAKATSTLLEILKILKAEESKEEEESLENMSILDVVMRRGMTFPRPCWWPEERGFK